MKKWNVLEKVKASACSGRQSSCLHRQSKLKTEDLIKLILKNRGLVKKTEIDRFLNPPHPRTLTAKAVSIAEKQLNNSIDRIIKAIKNKESIVVYSDYDADGITGGAIMWETLHHLGASVMPYIPDRVREGYGLSILGIDRVINNYQPKLIITVDHGITSYEKVAYAQSRGVEVIVTDHHVKPQKLPQCLLVHTTELCGAGIAWFVCKELFSSQWVVRSEQRKPTDNFKKELLALATIGTIADMVPLTGANRSIAKYGLQALNQTQRIGLLELVSEAGLSLGQITAYEVSHILAPRLNAMGRLLHALDALRLLCTRNKTQAVNLATKLGLTNQERQQLTLDHLDLAIIQVEERLKQSQDLRLLFIADEQYNQGVIGLVAGKLTEKYYLPAIVVSQDKKVSKASARSIKGFNIVEAIRSCADILLEVGGHPMAAGFSIESHLLDELKTRLEEYAFTQIDESLLTPVLDIDLELDFSNINEQLWQQILHLAPFGIGNPVPIFASRGVRVLDARLVGRDKQHLKLKLMGHEGDILEAIGFNLGEYYHQLTFDQPIDVAYALTLNEWNGKRQVELKLKDVQVS